MEPLQSNRHQRGSHREIKTGFPPPVLLPESEHHGGLGQTVWHAVATTSRATARRSRAGSRHRFEWHPLRRRLTCGLPDRNSDALVARTIEGILEATIGRISAVWSSHNRETALMRPKSSTDLVAFQGKSLRALDTKLSSRLPPEI